MLNTLSVGRVARDRESGGCAGCEGTLWEEGVQAVEGRTRQPQESDRPHTSGWSLLALQVFAIVSRRTDQSLARSRPVDMVLASRARTHAPDLKLPSSYLVRTLCFLSSLLFGGLLGPPQDGRLIPPRMI